jgi:hypothetical protein
MISNIFKPIIFFSLSPLQVGVIKHKTFLFIGQSYLKHGLMRFSVIGQEKTLRTNEHKLKNKF